MIEDWNKILHNVHETFSKIKFTFWRAHKYYRGQKFTNFFSAILGRDISDSKNTLRLEFLNLHGWIDAWNAVFIA